MKGVLFVIVAALSCVLTAWSAWCFAGFVSDFSDPRYDRVIDGKLNASLGPRTPDGQKDPHPARTTALILLWDLLLIVLFAIVHTVLAAPGIKRAFERCNLYVIQRSVYNAATGCSLKVLIAYWSTAYYYPLWVVDVKRSYTGWWIFCIVQCLAWFVVYSGCVMMDFAELLGVRQVYYYIRGLNEPLSYKSHDLQRLYSHMRHPSFVGFCAAFWLFPFMTPDRCLLALLLTAYMVAAFKVDRQDYVYQREQRVRKVYEMSHSASYSYSS